MKSPLETTVPLSEIYRLSNFSSVCQFDIHVDGFCLDEMMYIVGRKSRSISRDHRELQFYFRYVRI